MKDTNPSNSATSYAIASLVDYKLLLQTCNTVQILDIRRMCKFNEYLVLCFNRLERLKHMREAR
jgi:hypothetical protein